MISLWQILKPMLPISKVNLSTLIDYPGFLVYPVRRIVVTVTWCANSLSLKSACPTFLNERKDRKARISAFQACREQMIIALRLIVLISSVCFAHRYHWKGKEKGRVFPSCRLLGMCCWMGWHFHDWIDYYGVAFLKELLEWGRTCSGFWGSETSGI